MEVPTHQPNQSIDNGFIVPAITRILKLHDWWGVTSYITSGQFWVDVFLVFCWISEGVGLWYSSSNHWVGPGTYVIAVLIMYRLADLSNVLVERLVFGAYGPDLPGVASRERGLLLGLVNVAEIIVLHAGLFRIAAVAWPRGFKTVPALETFWDALELSAGRATTVGSRFALIGHGAVLLAISETVISLVIVIMLVSQLAGRPVGQPIITKPQERRSS
jgi:hypothetical protein